MSDHESPSGAGILTPPEGYAARPPNADDFGVVAGLVAASDLADFGEPDYPEGELLADLEQMDLASDAGLVFAPDGALAGYVGVSRFGARLDAAGFVHPQHAGRGVGTYLVRFAERRATELASLAAKGSRVHLNNNINGRNEAAARILGREGYDAVRHFWRMSIDLDGSPRPPVWPDGITVRACRGGDEATVFRVREEAFEDHWGHETVTFEEWERRKKRVSFDSGLWFLALDAGEPAGAAVCEEREGSGWVEELAVRKRWRRRGLGMALLRHVFCEFFRRGTREVSLGVDSESLTGATRLYERAGMSIDRLYSVYRKELRGG